MIKNLAIGSGSNRTFLLLALVLAALSAGLIAVFLSNAKGGEQGSTSTATTVPVVVAAVDIPAATRITEDMVTLQPLPQDLVLADVFRSLNDVVGQVAQVNILSGEQLVQRRVQAASATGQVLQADDLSDVVPLEKAGANCGIPNCGLRAMSLAVAPTTAAAGLIRPGDQVDVIAAFADASAVTVIQDVEVLAIDQGFERQVGDAKLEGGKENPEAVTATLSFWPDQAQKVAAAEEFAHGEALDLTPATKAALGLPDDARPQCKGSLRLVLRHAGQQGPVGGLEPRGTCATLFTMIWG